MKFKKLRVTSLVGSASTSCASLGLLIGIVVSTGPASVAVLIGYGLTKAVFIGTEVAGSLAFYGAKTLTVLLTGHPQVA